VKFLSKLLLDPEKLLRDALGSVDIVSGWMTKEMRGGVRVFGSAIVEELRKRKIVDKKLEAKLLEELKSWQKQEPK
jgi:hypothetical protein